MHCTCQCFPDPVPLDNYPLPCYHSARIPAFSTKGHTMPQTQLETYITENEKRFLEDLKGWLRIPSISTLPEHAGDIRRAAEYAAVQLRRIDFEQVQLIQTQNHPLVYGEWLKATGKPIVLVYGHYDVQPVDPVELWESPPFEPTVRGDNLYCRGACDDKGQTMLVLKALESLLEVNVTLPVNVRVLIEGEEEAGGESIDHYVRTYPTSLNCDAAFICDTGMPSSEIPALVNGLRGIIYTEVEVRGAKSDLHSGAYGGVAPNPLHTLAIIIAGVEVTVRKIHGGEAVMVPIDMPPIRAAASALKEVFGKEPVFIREGGSIPIAALFHDILGVPVVMMGFGLPDDNLHAPNEKYSLSQFYKGIRTVARFFENMG